MYNTDSQEKYFFLSATASRRGLQTFGLQRQVLHGFTGHTICVAAMGKVHGNQNIKNVLIGESYKTRRTVGE